MDVYSHLDYVVYGFPISSCLKCREDGNNFQIPLTPADTYRQLQREKKNPVFELSAEYHLDPKFSHASVTPFGQLKPTTIDQLNINAVAQGKYIILRIVEELLIFNGWHTVVEDSKGNGCFFSIYNFPALEQFSLGEVIVVKEPCYLFTGSKKKHYIRVDSPTDIFILNSAHPLSFLCKDIKWQLELGAGPPNLLMEPPVPNDYEEWFKRGNSLLDSGHYAQARDAFTISLRHCRPHSIQGKKSTLQLAKAYSLLGYKEKAYILVHDISKELTNDEEIDLAVIEYTYQLRLFNTSMTLLRIYKATSLVFANNLEDSQYWVIQNSLIYRNRERFSGRYEMGMLKAMDINKESSDCADYYKQHVILIDIPGKGRGLTLRRKMPARTLLLAVRALAIHYADGEFEEGINYSKDPLNLVSDVCQLVMKSPKYKAKKIYDLYSNAFNSGKEIAVYCNPEKKLEAICHVEIIRDICKMNAIPVEKVDDQGNKRIVGCALYHYPSYMNHGCVPTVSMEFISDMVFIYSINAMRKGDELLISYVPQNVTPDKKRELLAVRGISCHCPLCLNS